MLWLFKAVCLEVQMYVCGGWAGNAASGEAGEGLHSADGWDLVMLEWACPRLQCDEGDPDEPNFVFQWAQKFQILAVVDCKKMDPVYSPPSLQALGLSWLWAGLGIRFNQEDISKKGFKQRLKMCLYTGTWLLVAYRSPVPTTAVKKVGQTSSRGVWPRYLCCPGQQHATCHTSK